MLAGAGRAGLHRLVGCQLGVQEEDVPRAAGEAAGTLAVAARAFVLEPLPGPETAVLDVKHPARPYKSAILEYKTDSRWKSLRALERPGQARTAVVLKPSGKAKSDRI